MILGLFWDVSGTRIEKNIIKQEEKNYNNEIEIKNGKKPKSKDKVLPAKKNFIWIKISWKKYGIFVFLNISKKNISKKKTKLI